MPRMIKTWIQTRFTPNWSITNLSLTFDAFYGQIFTQFHRFGWLNYFCLVYGFETSKISKCGYPTARFSNTGPNQNLEYSEPIVLWTEPNEPFLTLPLTIYPVTYNLINRRLNFRLWSVKLGVKMGVTMDPKWWF